MSKKTKKAQIEVPTNQTAEENQVEVTQGDPQEVVPATIVEAGEAEVFQSQTEGRKTVEPAEQTAEKPKKPKVDRRPYIPFLTEALEQPQDRKELLKIILEKWPTVSKGGCQTFLTDMLNARYTFFKDRPVSKLPDGRIVFADKAPVAEAPLAEAEVPAAEVVAPIEETLVEQPAE